MNSPSAPVSPAAGLPTGAIASVFQAIGGLRNYHALVALLSCLVGGIIISVLATRLGAFGALLGALIFFVASGTGVNAAGVLLMDQARGTPLRSLTDALVYGLMCIPKLIVLGLALLLAAIAVFIVLAVLFLICKIPFLGPILFVVVFPLSVVVAGMTVFGLFVCMLLALPAIWEGLTVMRAIAQTLAIARTRLIETLLLLAVVGFLCLFVGFIVFGILASGLMPTIGMSTSILGGGGLGGLGALMGMLQGFGGGYGYGDGGGGGGYAIAAMIGGGVLWALAATLVSQVYLLGLNLVYLRSTEGLDTSEVEAALLRGLDDAKRRTAEFGEKAKAAANRDREPASPTAAVPSPLTATMPPAGPMAPAVFAATPVFTAAPVLAATPAARPMDCPKCAAPCTSDDLFCGVCGQRLK